jgi:hypothetical protein
VALVVVWGQRHSSPPKRGISIGYQRLGCEAESMGLQGCTAASEDHSRFLRHLRDSSMGCDCARYCGCSGRLADDLGHRQRTQGTLMTSTAQELQLLAGSQTVQEFNQLIDGIMKIEIIMSDPANRTKGREPGCAGAKMPLREGFANVRSTPVDNNYSLAYRVLQFLLLNRLRRERAQR